MEASIEEILLDSANFSEAVRDLYRFRRAKNSKYSLAWICKSSGIPSKGYLSEVMSGKRLLAQKYCGDLGHALGLSELAGEYLELLHARDQLDLDEKKLKELAGKIDQLRELLAPRKPALVDGMGLLSFTLISAVDLYGGKATEQQFQNLLGPQMSDRLEKALAHLIDIKVLKKEGDTYATTGKFFDFTEDRDFRLLFSILREGLKESSQKLDEYYPKKDQAFFEIATLVTNRAHLAKQIERFRASFRAWVAETDTKEADSIVRVNVQLYPVKQLC